MALLSAGHRAYREHFKGARAVMLQHLRGGGASSLDMPSAELERLDRLKEDYLAWRTYIATGELPQRVFSEGMDIPLMDADAHLWLSELRPERRASAELALPAKKGVPAPTLGGSGRARSMAGKG